MHPVFALVLGSLATFRLALMFSKENGPGRIFRKLRQAAPPKSATREGLSCEWCESIWWSAVITAYIWAVGGIPTHWTPLWWLAQSAVAIVLNQQWTAGKGK